MKKYKDISSTLKQSIRTEETYLKYDRNAFVSGELYKVGNIVEHLGRKAEIISLGSNYVTLIREGKTFKSWITDIQKVMTESAPSTPRIVSGQMVFKGFTTKNFNQALCELFLQQYLPESDQFAYYSCLVSCDRLIGATSNSLIEQYHKYKMEYDKVSRYLNKFDISIDRVKLIGEALELILQENKKGAA